jgi:NADH:ubiquinone oxidoreductase subunit B-like Fe-S oxidoreductase
VGVLSAVPTGLPSYIPGCPTDKEAVSKLFFYLEKKIEEVPKGRKVEKELLDDKIGMTRRDAEDGKRCTSKVRYADRA